MSKCKKDAVSPEHAEHLPMSEKAVKPAILRLEQEAFA